MELPKAATLYKEAKKAMQDQEWALAEWLAEVKRNDAARGCTWTEWVKATGLFDCASTKTADRFVLA